MYVLGVLQVCVSRPYVVIVVLKYSSGEHDCTKSSLEMSQ